MRLFRYHKMEKKKIILLFALFLIIFFVLSCDYKDIEIKKCIDFSKNYDCNCNIGLDKFVTKYGVVCLNSSCNMLSLNYQCLDNCPDNYTYIRIKNGTEKIFYVCYKIVNLSEMDCSNFPGYIDCFCPAGFEPRATLNGMICRPQREKCDGYRLNNTCVQKCPQGYEPVIIYDTGGDPFCRIIKNENQ